MAKLTTEIRDGNETTFFAEVYLDGRWIDSYILNKTLEDHIPAMAKASYEGWTLG